jgi:hypothetical protein
LFCDAFNANSQQPAACCCVVYCHRLAFFFVLIFLCRTVLSSAECPLWHHSFFSHKLWPRFKMWPMTKYWVCTIILIKGDEPQIVRYVAIDSNSRTIPHCYKSNHIRNIYL